jgi:hypothetical protein
MAMIPSKVFKVAFPCTLLGGLLWIIGIALGDYKGQQRWNNSPENLTFLIGFALFFFSLLVLWPYYLALRFGWPKVLGVAIFLCVILGIFLRYYGVEFR